MSKESIGPEKVYEELLAEGGHGIRQKNLKAIQEVCRSEYAAGNRSFSTANIGRVL